MNQVERNGDRKSRVAYLLVDACEQERALLLISHDGGHAKSDGCNRDETDEQTRTE